MSDLPSTAANAPNRSQFSVPLSLGDFVRYVLAAWPGAGWQDGRGDAEPGEAEAPFSKGTVVGAFRAYDNQCGGPHVTVTIVTAPAP